VGPGEQRTSGGVEQGALGDQDGVGLSGPRGQPGELGWVGAVEGEAVGALRVANMADQQADGLCRLPDTGA